jgi:hypothetical protein
MGAGQRGPERWMKRVTMANNNKKTTRTNAIAQLHRANKMLQDGRRELAAANKKIEQAQKLIDESARILRETHTELPQVNS